MVDMIGFPPYILEEKKLQKKYATVSINMICLQVYAKEVNNPCDMK